MRRRDYTGVLLPSSYKSISGPVNSRYVFIMILKDFQDHWLAPQSSPVDWCEENYSVNSNIAEFTNTFSNFVHIILPLICIKYKLWDNYTKLASGGVKYILYIHVLIGLFSTYFHATLSLFGQMLDEVCIVIALCVGYSYFLADKYKPKYLTDSMARVIGLIVAVLLTLTWFISPAINAFWIMILSSPLFAMIIRDYKFEKNETLVRIIKINLTFATTAFVCWVIDKATCGVWLSLGIPGLHNIWHILSGVAGYLSLLIHAYWKVEQDMPFIKANINFKFGVPYINCKDEMSYS